MHILALQKRALENPEKESILREMKNICALNPSADVLQTKLSDCKFLPVRRSSGEIEWMASTSDFAVVDRREYRDIFRNKIDMLDLSLEEVHSLNLFLNCLGLEGRYMSRVVEEETMVRDGQPNDQLTNDLRRKAYAICR
jgi:hypothetical protein